MKPKVNPRHPVLKPVIEGLNNQVKIALETEQTVEKAIIPIYAIPKSKGHQKPKTKPEQFGTGVLLNIKDQYFVLSSTHIFEAFHGKVLMTGTGDRTLIENLGGERFSTGFINKPYQSKLDATVFHIQSELSENLKSRAIGLDDLEFEDDLEKIKPVYLSIGFRNKMSNTSGDQVKSKGEAFASVEVDSKTYHHFKIDKKAQILTSYEDDILVDGQWKKSPRPKGFSGGGLVKIEGTNLLIPSLSPNQTYQKLRAIITEHHKDRHNQLGVLVSTKINVHIGLIYQFLPELFPEIDDNTVERYKETQN